MKDMRPYAAVLLVSLLVSCASNHSSQRVAEAAREEARPTGYLQVFTATETRPDGDSTFAYPHTGYTLYDQNGKMVKYIRNHVGRMDGVPTMISVPAGRYRIKAETEGYGDVTFPIEIKPGRVDVVHLERGSEHAHAHHGESEPVRLPDGQVVGWTESVQ
jgi:hypothetical protein